MKECVYSRHNRPVIMENNNILAVQFSKKEWTDGVDEGIDRHDDATTTTHTYVNRLRRKRSNAKRQGRHKRSKAASLGGSQSPRLSRSPFMTHSDIRALFEGVGDINIDSFELLRVIGSGSSGIVTKALFIGKDLPEQPLPPFCIKSIDKAKMTNSKQVEHLQRELHVLKMLADTPNCVQLYSVFQDRNCFHFVTDFIPGGDLFQRIYKTSKKSRHRVPLHIEEVRFYFAELVAIVQRFHAMDIVYRDIKPENVMIAASGHIKLIDFGFAKVLKESEKYMTRTICGTMEYISPELAMALLNKQSEADHGKAVDYWSLAVCLYELCTGNSIFGSYCNDMMELYTAVVQRKIRFPRNFDPQCKDLIKHCLRSDPSTRLGNADRPLNRHDFLRYDQWGNSIDWEDVKNNRLEPPWIPQLKGPLDSQVIQRPSGSEIRSFGKGGEGGIGERSNERGLKEGIIKGGCFDLASEDLFNCFGPILPNEPTFTRLVPD